MLPSVTGIRFARKFSHVSEGKSTGVLPIDYPERFRRAGLDEQSYGNEVDIGDAVLEASGGKGRDRRHDRHDPVDRGTRAVAHPDCETDQRIAEDAEREGGTEAQRRLAVRDGERVQPDRAAAERVLRRHEIEHRGRDRADEISGKDDSPV